MNNVKNLEGFFDTLEGHIEGASMRVGDPPAFLIATRAIEKLLAEDWPVLEMVLVGEGATAADKQRMLQLLQSLNALETKTRARLAWSKDFEAHLRRAMETKP